MENVTLTPVQSGIEITLTIEYDDAGAFTVMTVLAGPQFEAEHFCNSFVEGLRSGRAKATIDSREITFVNNVCPTWYREVQFFIPERDSEEMHMLARKGVAFNISEKKDEEKFEFRIARNS